MARTETSGVRQRHKQERKERIYRAALQLFRQQGFEATTVEEIAAAADVAKGTFFNYFPTKEAVLLSLGEQQMGGLRALVSLRNLDSATAIERIKRLLRSLADSAEEDRDLVRMMVFQALRVSDLVPSGANRFGLRAIVALLVTQAQRAGEVRADISADTVASLIEAVYLHELFLWCDSAVPYALGRRLEGLVDLLLAGVGPPG